jgi:hypothetical protein
MKVAIAVADSNYRHPGIRRRISTSVEVFKKRECKVDVFPLSSKFLGKNLGWFASAYPFEISDYDVVIQRSVLLARSMKSSIVETHAFSERHVSLLHPESIKDGLRVIWEQKIFNPVHESEGLFYVTSEIERLDDLRYPSLVVGNPSLDTDLFTSKRFPASRRVGMSIANLASWSGIDIFIELALSQPSFTFVILMPVELKLRKRLLGGLPRNVQLVSAVNYLEYVAELKTWSHAVGPLALERKGLTEAAPLKVRDYVSLGIPTFIRYKDTNLRHCIDPAIFQVDPSVESWKELFIVWLVQESSSDVLDSTKDCIDPMRVEGSKIDFITSVLNSENYDLK